MTQFNIKKACYFFICNKTIDKIKVVQGHDAIIKMAPKKLKTLKRDWGNIYV